MNTQIKTRTLALPKILTFKDVKYYIFSAVFIASAVFFPWLAHQFKLVGPQFLPMQYFVLIAGFLLGWRTGLIVGLFSVLFSYAATHMPPLAILPQIVLELSVYGFAIGILREKNSNMFVALISAMVLGRLVRIGFILTMGLKMSAISFIQMSFSGILLQIILIPLIIHLLEKFVFPKRV